MPKPNPRHFVGIRDITSKSQLNRLKAETDEIIKRAQSGSHEFSFCFPMCRKSTYPIPTLGDQDSSKYVTIERLGHFVSALNQSRDNYRVGIKFRSDDKATIPESIYYIYDRVYTRAEQIGIDLELNISDLGEDTLLKLKWIKNLNSRIIIDIPCGVIQHERVGGLQDKLGVHIYNGRINFVMLGLSDGWNSSCVGIDGAAEIYEGLRCRFPELRVGFYGPINEKTVIPRMGAIKSTIKTSAFSTEANYNDDFSFIEGYLDAAGKVLMGLIAK